MAIRWMGLAAFALGLILAGNAGAQTSAGAACPPLLQHSFNRLQDDKPQPLCQYAGKVLLVVNTASYCGFTPQYEGLEALHAKYAARGLVVMGFPSNDFGQQEPGGSQQIAELCFRALKRDFRHIDTTSARIVLLDAAPAVLAPFGEKLSRDAEAILTGAGVEVILGAKVVGVDADGVTYETADGAQTHIPSACKVWAAGVAASPTPRESSSPSMITGSPASIATSTTLSAAAIRSISTLRPRRRAPSALVTTWCTNQIGISAATRAPSTTAFSAARTRLTSRSPRTSAASRST